MQPRSSQERAARQSGPCKQGRKKRSFRKNVYICVDIQEKTMAKVATNTNFNELLQDSKLVIVDFWATWCGPCRMLSPILDEVEEEMADKITVVKVNVDDADEVAAQFRIMSIPTLLFFKNGQAVDKTVGAMPKNELVKKINENL